MWLSKKAAEKPKDTGAEIGYVTIGGEKVGVLAGNERRGLRVCSPGGYHWRPKTGGEMLIIKCDDGADICAGSPESGSPVELQSGEVCIASDGGAVLVLKNDGRVVITGLVEVLGGLSVNGNAVG